MAYIVPTGFTQLIPWGNARGRNVHWVGHLSPEFGSQLNVPGDVHWARPFRYHARIDGIDFVVAHVKTGEAHA